MARLPYVSREQLPKSERDLFDHIEKQFGRLNNIFRILAYHPLLLRRLLHFAEGLRHATRLDPRLRELAILTVGRLTQCEYESVHHSALAQRLGVRPMCLLAGVVDYITGSSPHTMAHQRTLDNPLGSALWYATSSDLFPPRSSLTMVSD